MLGVPVRTQARGSGRQEVHVTIDRGYHPALIIARAGVPLLVTFHRSDNDACSERVVFSSPRIDRRISPTGSTTVELPPLPPGDVRFTCAMGRYRGHIRVVGEGRYSLFGLVGLVAGSRAGGGRRAFLAVVSVIAFVTGAIAGGAPGLAPLSVALLGLAFGSALVAGVLASGLLSGRVIVGDRDHSDTIPTQGVIDAVHDRH